MLPPAAAVRRFLLQKIIKKNHTVSSQLVPASTQSARQAAERWGSLAGNSLSPRAREAPVPGAAYGPAGLHAPGAAAGGTGSKEHPRDLWFISAVTPRCHRSDGFAIRV